MTKLYGPNQSDVLELMYDFHAILYLCVQKRVKKEDDEAPAQTNKNQRGRTRLVGWLITRAILL